MPRTTLVSSPGKVLIAGGYLVLDPKYPGVVVSTSSRFYTAVSDLTVPPSDVSMDVDPSPAQIRVRSPQFVDATWVYFVNVDDTGVRVEQVADGAATATKNKFVQLALERTLLLAQETQGAAALRDTLARGLDICIVGDNDFYSQRKQLSARDLPPTLASLAQLPPFLPTGVRLPEVHKTGLGSSAALITSLVSALLLHLRVIPSDSFDSDPALHVTEGRRLAHNLAQYVHCLAQGKVGSGFDVSSAVFGSQLYTRFDPLVLQPLMDDSLASVQSLSRALSPGNPAWDYRVAPFKLPPATRLMLADVDAGSDTPSLVGKVLKWRKENSTQANALWDALDTQNRQLSNLLLSLSMLHDADPVNYAIVVKYLSTLQYRQWLAHPSIPDSQLKMIEAFSGARDVSESIREHMREMGTHSGVPIEPPEQTTLLDACISVAGVIGGGVPGAGGYDALWLLVFDPEDCPAEELPSHRVEALWTGWQGMDVSPLLATEAPPQARGVRVEGVEGVPGMAEVLQGGS